MIKYVDLFLLDIKHIDEDKCIKLTGKSNKNTISFAEYLNKNNKPVWIRYVLVPGITDNLNDLEKTKLFIDSLSNVEKVEVLPYHKLGITKYQNLGIIYPLIDVEVPSSNDIELVKNIFNIK